MILIFLWTAVLGAALYLYFQKIYSFFSSRGVKTTRVIPPFGHAMGMSFKTEHFVCHMDRIYFNFPGERILGRYEFTTPIVMIRDLEMIKKIAIKDFDHFVDRRRIIDPEADPLITKNIFSMKVVKGQHIQLGSQELVPGIAVTGAMREREEKKIVRNDMIHLLMEAKKEWSDDDLIAQAMVFLLAGFDTVSSVMTFLIYELALHSETQDKLVEEIKENHLKNNGKLDYNSILNMPYLDMVVSEVMRLWPPALTLDRVCMKDYNCGKPNSKSTEDFIIPKGMNINIPVWSIHRDPDYFPDPQRFDPERFSEENRHNIRPFSYMPFSLGPRNCIGNSQYCQ